MFSSTTQDNPNIRCHIINCDTFQGYVTIELMSCNMKIFSLTNQTVEEIKLRDRPISTGLAYRNNHQIPAIIVADCSAYINIWEYNPSENNWQSSGLSISNIKPPECYAKLYIATYENKVMIIYPVPHKIIMFKFILINLNSDNKNNRLEYSSPIRIVPTPTSFTLVMNELFITSNKNKLTFNKDSSKYESTTYLLYNEITNAIYIPDKDLPYMIFITYDSHIKKTFLTSILIDMMTVLNDSFSFNDCVRNMTYNDKIILATLDNGKVYQINPLSKNSDEIICRCGKPINAFIINNQILYIRNCEMYSILNSLNNIKPTLSFHVFSVDKIITQIYSENEDTIIVENNENNQKVYFKSNIIGYCNKNSKIELPREKNIKYFDNNHNINLEYKYSYNIEAGKNESKENKITNSILINIKNKLEICDFVNTIIYSQIIGDYLYCIISNNTISKWKYDISEESFILEYSKELNNSNNSKITYANGNINYLCIYYGNDRTLSIYNIDCFDQVNCSVKIKPITTLYMNDYNQIYTGNEMGMVKRFDLKCSLKDL